MPLRTLIVVGLVAFAVAGCGRRGSLEDPPARVAPAAEEETLPTPPTGSADTAPGSGSASITLDAASPGAQEPQVRREPTPQRRFFLDFLL